MGKNIFIVFCHPDKDSLNGALLDTAIAALEKHDHVVTVSDLCRMNFDPVLGRHDIIDPPSVKDKWIVDWVGACREGRIPQYIKDEQSKIMEADLIIFQFPIFYLGFPALLKGWMEKVCSEPFAYELPNKVIDEGNLKGKKAVLSFTTGGDASAYTNRGMFGDLDVLLWPLNSGLKFLGLDVLPPNIGCNISTEEEGRAFLDAWKKRLEGIFDEEPLFFFPLADHASNGELKQDIIDRAENKGDTGPTVGQHLGMRMPAGSMRKRLSF